ncbi:response regulator RpfG family c-di-GMP phosphodiesterase [Janthinobacterium sp. CG_23.3]|uniref:HD domain-containing phosphohydrolase n=1 Tax=unclassified Janthinobacterium TaxID=2610881 RepID=UPI002E006F8F|nr:response regulator RpfG family c-di-GMP phosphodiesterase [Janthinobacterium sp. CG_S6]
MTDEMLFEDDEAPQAKCAAPPPWQVMIVDDEESVHQVTRLVMSDFSFDGRGVQFSSCYSAAEAGAALAQGGDVALILLDVVMEHEHAGLDLVRFIRDELHNHSVRIVLRTGQPGQAPQEYVIRNYDINDYREKTELTHGKLSTVFYSALRGYRDLMRLQRARDGLRRSIEAITAVCDADNLRGFCSAVLAQAGALLGQDGEGVCAGRLGTFAAARLDDGMRVLAVTPAYAGLAPQTSLDHLPGPVRAAFERAMAERRGHQGELHHLSYHRTGDGNESFLYMAFAEPIGADARETLAAFAANVAITYEKLLQREELEATQEATVAILGEALGRRSAAPGAHAERVGAIAAMLGAAAGMAPAAVRQLRLAAPLHDAGHCGVPDAMLHAPGPLDAEQWQLMRRHTGIGRDMLARSPRPVLQLAAAIAHEHHERWDGGGYPRALAGEQIGLAARITALADFIDAMVSPRSYRQAWSLEHTLRQVREESGKRFAPDLVAHLFERLDWLRALYLRLPPD